MSCQSPFKYGNFSQPVLPAIFWQTLNSRSVILMWHQIPTWNVSSKPSSPQSAKVHYWHDISFLLCSNVQQTSELIRPLTSVIEALQILMPQSYKWKGANYNVLVEDNLPAMPKTVNATSELGAASESWYGTAVWWSPGIPFLP